MRKTGWILLFYAGSLAAQSPNIGSDTKPEPPCSVLETDNPLLTTGTFAFSGHVNQAATYTCAFAPRLIFRLEPVANGWVIAVLEENGKVNLARYTPQFGDHSDLAVPPADLMKTGESGPRAQVDRLPHEQNFYFSLHFDRPTKKVPSAQELGRMKQTGTGLLRITDLGWATAQAGQQVVESMRFDVVIQLLAIHGVPVYGNSLGVVPPKAIYTPDPQYSREARRAGFQGTVVLWMVVDVDGYPAAVKVVRSVGMGLDEKAVDAVRKWKFIPGLKDGKPVPIQINVEVAFRL